MIKYDLDYVMSKEYKKRLGVTEKDKQAVLEEYNELIDEKNKEPFDKKDYFYKTKKALIDLIPVAEELNKTIKIKDSNSD